MSDHAFWGLPSKEFKIACKQLLKENKDYPKNKFVEVPVKQIDVQGKKVKYPIKALRSQDFLVAIYETEIPGIERLSINRTVVDVDKRRWADKITWDSLQAIKTAIGYGQYHAVEVFPADDKLIDVANIRHLFVYKDVAPPEFIWGIKS